MSDITISYKGNSIATMDATGTKTLLTEGKYCEDDIEVAYVKPSGGGVDDPFDFSGGNILAITSHGTEYIETDIYPSFNSNFCTKFKDVNSSSYEYYWGTSYDNMRACVQRNGSYLNLYVNNWGLTVNFPGFNSGEIITPFIGAVGITQNVANKALYIFRGYYGGNLESQIATYTFYGLNILNDESEFVNRLRPWLENGVACIKDLESGKIYTNSGTGGFDYIDLEGVTHNA